MNPKTNISSPDVNEAQSIPVPRQRANGSKRRTGADPIPGINLRELYAERNWPALIGLGLIATGVLVMVLHVLDIHFDLLGLVLLGIGGWLMFDAAQRYQANGHTWTDISRNRMTGGAVIVLIGAMVTFDLGWWGLALVVAGVLGYDAWKQYEANGRAWTDTSRNRLAVAVAVGIIGAFGFLNAWSAWPLILIAIGAAVLLGCVGRKVD